MFEKLGGGVSFKLVQDRNRIEFNCRAVVIRVLLHVCTTVEFFNDFNGKNSIRKSCPTRQKIYWTPFFFDLRGNRVFTEIYHLDAKGRRKIFAELILYANEKVSIFMKQF